MIKVPAAIAPAAKPPTPTETEEQRFERILLRSQFKPLKAVFDNLGQPIPVLQAAIIRVQGPDSPLAAVVGGEAKGKLSILLYAAAIPAAFVAEWVADALYVVVALIWLVPDRRIERLQDRWPQRG